MEWDVATSLQWENLHGSYGLYVAVTGCTWQPSSKRHVDRGTAMHVDSRNCLVDPISAMKYQPTASFRENRLKGLSHWRRRRRGNSGDSGDQKMACALTKATSRRRLQTRWQPIRPEVAGTSPWRLRDVFSVVATSPTVSKVGQAASCKQRRGDAPQCLLSLLGLQQVSETSRRRLPSRGQN